MRATKGLIIWPVLVGLAVWQRASPLVPAGALAVAVVWLGLVALLLLAKYAFYPNAAHIRLTQVLVLGVALLLLGHPLYPVLLLVAAVGLPWQSRRRLNSLIS